MVINKETAISYTEIIAILKCLKTDDYNKIPKEKMLLYEKLRDKEYIFNYNKEIPIEQQISNKSKAILANIFYNYIANDEEKRILQKKDFEEFEKETTLVNLNPLFENKKKKTTNQQIEELSLVKVNKNNIFQKVLLAIKRFFRR